MIAVSAGLNNIFSIIAQIHFFSSEPRDYWRCFKEATCTEFFNSQFSLSRMRLINNLCTSEIEQNRQYLAINGNNYTRPLFIRDCQVPQPRRTFHLYSFFFCLLSVRCTARHSDHDRNSSCTYTREPRIPRSLERYQRPTNRFAGGSKMRTVVTQSYRLWRICTRTVFFCPMLGKQFKPKAEKIGRYLQTLVSRISLYSWGKTVKTDLCKNMFSMFLYIYVYVFIRYLQISVWLNVVICKCLLVFTLHKFKNKHIV